MSVSLFDYFGVEADLGPQRSSDGPVPLKYRPATLSVRPLVNATFEPYVTQRIAIPGSRTHGTALVESGALASVQPPVPTYRPTLEPSLISRGVLSAEQLETIIYAGQQHEQTFTVMEFDQTVSPPVEVPKRYRCGFFLADGTGVGKGRQAAGIIRSEFNRTRTRAVWLSLNELLIADARRDWVDLGGRKDDVVLWSKTALNDELNFRYGILYGTYALLRSHNKETSRLQQLIAALGCDFDGVIIFDEAHAGANADPSSDGGEQSRAASEQGKAMLDLQMQLPDARIVYVSATGASRLDALSYAPRLRLWGVGTGFESRSDFLMQVSEGGTSAQEVVSRYLKATGRFCARTLSYEGVQYERLVHDLDEEQVESYNAYIAVWRMIENGFVEELLRLGAVLPPENGNLDVTAVAGSPLGRTRSRIQSGKQRFFAHTLMSLKMPSTIVKMRQELAAGNAVVIQITHTDEARLDRALSEMADDDSLDDLDLGHRDFLINFVRNHYPVSRYRSQRADNKRGIQVSIVLDPVTGKPEIDPQAVARRDDLMATLQDMIFPEGALDLLYDAFGYEAIAEVSGRSKMMLRQQQADGSRSRVLVPRSSKENQLQTDAFLSDRKQILVFTEGAGGVGRSYHAGTAFKNQRRRVHIILETSWRAEGAIQGLGRTHRTGQAAPPRYVFATTNVPGEKRLTSTPARRIAALGALSRGQREAADNGIFRAQDNLETPYAEAALRDLIADIAGGRVPGMDRQLFFLQTGIDVATAVVMNGADAAAWPPKKVPGNAIRMTKFLNRLMSVDIAVDGGLQRVLLDALMDRIEARIDDAIAQGRYDLGVETYAPKNLRILDRQTIDVDPSSGASTELLTLEVQEDYSDINTFAAAIAMRERYERVSDKHDTRFVFNDAGEVELHIPVRHEEIVPNPVVRIIRPVGERSRFKNDGRTYTELTPAAAEAAWDREIAALSTVTRTLYAIAGALLPVWSRLPSTMPTIYRMQTDAGERLLARIVPLQDMATVAATFAVTFEAAA